MYHLVKALNEVTYDDNIKTQGPVQLAGKGTKCSPHAMDVSCYYNEVARKLS